MSERIPDIKIDINKIRKDWEAVKHRATLLETATIMGVELDVYMTKSSDFYELFFMYDDDGNDIIALYVSFHSLPDDGIQMHTVTRVLSKGIFMHILYRDYLLKNFKYILSDDTHTSGGFGIYQRLADYPDLKVSVLKNGEVVEDDVNALEMKKYWGGPEYRDYIFRVEYHSK